jgi:hypothetical protein
MPFSDDATKNTEAPDHEGDNEEKSMSNPFRWILEHIIKGKSDAWQAIGAVVVAFMTIMLYRVGNDTNELTRATQRALVSFAGTSPGPSLSSQDHKIRLAQEVVFNWSNSGTTQARNAITSISGQGWPTELPQGFDFPDLPGSQRQTIALGPKETTGVRTQIAMDQISNSWEGKSHLYTWGWIVYDDVFGSRPHLTEFCVEFLQITIPSGKTSTDFSDPNMAFSWNIQKCKQHNCYNDDCKDYSDRVQQARPQ